ncbi:juvenile hormone esterase-like isoform X2 [Euwallacea fornicatus]|uniref:juvenile hormone esterase-like isoform X2 n=1 Tax=Euwallacea fornicatus TaxID=995702 RepID=UPI003390130F
MGSLWSVLFAILLNFNCGKVAFGQEEAPIISITDGRLRGTTSKTVGLNVTYYAYRGIPYAKKPINDLRFAAPVKNSPWTGTLNATADRDFCVQLLEGIPFPGSTNRTVVGSEDCLYINVYTTGVNKSLPVMVWIYGGGFYSGFSDYKTYAPDYLLEKEVVYVAFNYRLGIFGFLSLGDLVAPGNWGIKDQILALKWVQENIKHFGGDPRKVTIFGESAGAASVSYLLHTSKTNGLFEKAIMQSGSSVCGWALTRSPKTQAYKVAISLGIISSNSKHIVNELRKMDYKTLKLAESEISALVIISNIFDGLPFGVVKEPNHPEAVFSNSSWELFKSGQFQRVPILAGYNSLEVGNALSYYDQIKQLLFIYDLQPNLLAPYGLTQNFFKQLVAGLEVKKHFFHLRPITVQPEALAEFLSVELFERPIRENVVLASAFTRVYFYRFSYKGLLGDPLQISSGVTHAEELRYLFVVPNQTVNEQDRAVIDKFVTLWTNFAKTGDPTPHNNSHNNTILGGLTWSPNESNKNVSTTIEYLNINSTLTMETNPSQDDWLFYQTLYEKFGTPPYATY